MPLATVLVPMFLAALMLAGCAAPVATERFYTLSAAAPAHAEKPGAEPPRRIVAVGPVRVPEIVDRPQFVVREGGNRVALVERHRWAQPLHAEIARALAMDLEQRLPQTRVATYNEHAAQNPDCRVVIDIERFDAVLGVAVSVQGLWSASCGTPAVARTGRSAIREAAGGEGFDALAAAYSRALAGMSADIAHAISSIPPRN